MRHKLSKFRINRFTSYRRATMLSMVRNLFTYQSIKTTKQRAKETKAMTDSILALAQQNTLIAKRKVYELLGDHALVKRIFDDIAPRFSKRTGGFTRVLNLGIRRGDSSEMAIVELTEIKKKEERKPKKKAEAPKAADETIDVAAHEVDAGEAVKPEEIKHKEPKAVREKAPVNKKPSKNFLGGLKGIFKKERDSL
ncbi:MAG TPA: 50S ribosomal protein L17 [Candidatus Omnitrophota bacterium]|nr:50S ribosomal protein L17 [Candidatus Omnitrophota bacterium]HPT07555.1 50S ribosomal protein L17 [Candidatus Omnitrophota bacterium]